MPCKCPCFSNRNGKSKNFAEKLDENQRKSQERQARVLENFRILREELYEGEMKNFFKTGQDYRQYARLHLQEDMAEEKYRAKLGGNPDDQADKGAFANYILINPDTSRTYDLWQIILLAASLTEFVSFPYNVATDVRLQLYDEDNNFTNFFYIEFVIDIVFVLNMVCTFATAFRGDFGWIETFPQIVLNYVSSVVFYFDLVSTFPTLVTLYDPTYYWLYFFKVVRLYNLIRVTNIVGWFVPKLTQFGCNKKQLLAKIQYFINLTIVLLVLFQVIACSWLYVGDPQYRAPGYPKAQTWIHHPTDGLLAEHDNADANTKYITSIYWVVTTLTTVGYGDYKGFTTTEYVFTMVVEFIGILFFSVIMASVNDILDDGSSDYDIVETKLENVDVWLVKLDNSRMSK